MGKFALLVGVSEYQQQGIENLPNSVNDVGAVQEMLEASQFGAFDEVDCLKNPTKGELERAVNYLFANRQSDDLVLFYFSGHGLRDRAFDLHFGLSATELDEKKVVRSFSAYRASEMHREMNSSRSERQVIILDCCFSGAFTKGLNVKGDKANLLDIKPDELGGKGRAILTSSASTKYSFVRENSELSIYTHYLVDGIRSGAADRDNDGWIGVDELFEYTQEKVTQESSAMTPQFYPVKEGFKILLARSPQDDPKLRYRKQVIEIIREEHEDIDFIAGEFDPIDRDTLDDLRQELELEESVAAEIERIEMQPYRLKQEKLNQFQKTYENAVKRHDKLTERQIRKLRRRQERLGLRDEDVAQWISIEKEEVIQTATPISPSQKESDELPKSFTEDLGNGVKLEMVLIPKGSFLMGSTDEEVARLIKESGNDWCNCEKPQHRVEITQEFYIGKYQVTQGQWQAVMGNNPSHFKNGDDYPVEQVSWDDCHEFLDKLNQKVGKLYRLPSEAEWEYACRAGNTSRYHFGNDVSQLTRYCWCANNSGDENLDSGEIWRTDQDNYRERILKNNCRTHTVGKKRPNQFGLHDIHGNVWEWCEDSWEDSYQDKRSQKPFVNSGDKKVLRGGAWHIYPEYCRSAARNDFSRGDRLIPFGFRVVCSLPS